ncbi:restriction endonuclease subunit S [Acinetobacter indicus]|uniref:restriction endonuclease subunit S n=1 Tax=Acinetobacter indicus TaxID=756892 RepID=UPI000CEB8A42|nr:restriction endonuclease subunit S [Acinetobacter indicus]
MAVPKLRFKEFDGDWTKSSLINLAKDKSLNNGVFNDQNKVGQGYKLINVLDMYIERDIDESRLSLLDLDLKEFERNKVKFGDIFFTRSSLVKEGIAFSNVYLGHSQDITYDGHLIKLSPDLEVTNPSFLNYALKTSKVRKQLIQGGKTATMTTIGQQEVGKTTIDFPVLDEQTKIASFLSAVDEKISQLTEKHALLSQYKQGMMQKLFSQQIRFKADDGSEFGEWEEKCLSELFEYANGKSFEAEVVENGKFKLITLNSIDIKANLKKVHKTISNSDNSLIKNDLIMILSDVAHGNFLGLTAIIPDNSYVLNQRVGRLRSRSRSEINIVFIRFYINFNQKYFKLNGQGSSQLNLSKADILNFPVSLPCLEEQTKIANFLSSIDQKIEVVAQQIEQAKTWKKGLLQQMFV